MPASGNVQQIAQSKSQPDETGGGVSDKDFADLLADFDAEGGGQIDVDVPSQLAGQAGEVRAIQDQNREPEDPQAPGFFENLEQQQPQDFDPEGELTDPAARATLSFATTRRELLTGVSNQFGENNARLTERGVEFRDGPKDKWKLIDNEKISNYLDVLDFTRTAAEGVIENVGRAGGFIGGASAGAPAGAVVGLPAGPIGATAGAVTGGILQGVVGASIAGGVSSAAAIEFTDRIQEEILNIERDPERSKVVELGVAGALGAGFDFLAAKHGKRVAQAKVKSKALGETMQAVRKRVTDIEDNLGILKAAGIVKDKGKLRLLPNQAAGDLVPEFDKIAKELATENGFNNFVRKQGEAIEDAIMGSMELVGNVRGVRDPQFAKKISDSVFSTRAVEGRIIGGFRDQAMRASKGSKYNLDRTKQVVGDVIEELGIHPQPGEIPIVGQSRLGGLSPEDILVTHPDLTKDQATAFLGLIKKFETLGLAKSGLNLRQVDKQYTILRGQLDTLFKARTGLPLAQKLLPIKNALRDDWTDIIGKELGPSAREGYEQAMGKFGETMGNLGKINKVLANSEIGRDAFVKTIFSKGRLALPQLKAMRTMIQEQSPQLWKDLVGEHLDNIVTKHTVGTTGEVKWGNIRKEINGMGQETIKEVFSGTPHKPEVLDAALNIGEFFQKNTIKPQAAPVKQSKFARIIRSAVVLFSSTLATQKADTTAELVNSLGGRNNLLTQYLSAGGVEDIVKMVPKAQRTKLRGWISEVRDRAIDLSAAPAKTTIRAGGVDAIRPE